MVFCFCFFGSLLRGDKQAQKGACIQVDFSYLACGGGEKFWKVEELHAKVGFLGETGLWDMVNFFYGVACSKPIRHFPQSRGDTPSGSTALGTCPSAWHPGSDATFQLDLGASFRKLSTDQVRQPFQMPMSSGQIHLKVPLRNPPLLISLGNAFCGLPDLFCCFCFVFSSTFFFN